jgi:hypothetical protein
MIDPSAKLSVSRQAIALGISRGSVYYTPRPVSDADLKENPRSSPLQPADAQSGGGITKVEIQ